ncbi:MULTISPECIES: AAA family ATPase [Acidiphilium]|uniref:AAA family ATPase n=1 Tax=Acidiphilium TaxID=522 RepID=UPI002582984A|nr:MULTISPECIES: AAA family ATPase [Acidiphilium]HQT85078.1 AAA family ATPase [Acidiphilium rubrum]
MHIKFIEIANFRKLLSIRIDLADSTTLFVGANNSGKTSAIQAMRKFLSPRGRPFEVHDITLCRWPAIDAIGHSWVEARKADKDIALDFAAWENLLPFLDLWLQVEGGELHYVRDLIPTLDWEGGLLGVRLRLEPKDFSALFKDYLAAVSDAEALKDAAEQKGDKGGEVDAASQKLTVWPANLTEFLGRKLSTYFAIRAYSLDPSKVSPSQGLQATPQTLPADSLLIEGDPLEGLIRVNDIPAQRGFGEIQPSDGEDGAPVRSGGSRLSEQLRTYYAKHLDPTDRPDASDLGALLAIEAAQKAFDTRLTESFAPAFSEVEGMNYPGVTDPRPKVSTKLKAIDGLNHAAAISFEVDVIEDDGVVTPLLRLPEGHNGLGYQNLISMIFRLMAFRDAWMRVGKAGKTGDAILTEPLHLVLVEEPEAHLHAQVQQVFIKKAYNVLRAHKNLKDGKRLRTQLIVSTHSSHVAHETSFSCLRYFRRLPAGMAATVPVSSVINLTEVFGDETETKRFVTRYLRAQHADLFFADAAILVEGPAERMLLPNFIRAHYPFLNQCYVTLLEIGGSHAHRLKGLIEHLGLTTLIITDLDSAEKTGGSSVQPAPGAKQVTNNSTLKSWVPGLSDVDALLAAKPDDKIKKHDPLFEVRAAYQTGLKVKRPKAAESEDAYPYTFEDAFAFQNLEAFSKMEGGGLVRKFRDAINNESTAPAIGAKMMEELKTGSKAEFALDVIGAEDFENLAVPTYIAEGLSWLEKQLSKKQAEILPKTEKAAV